MQLGFDEVVVPVQYLRSTGVHQNATLTSVKYDATETYEYYDIELDVDGKKFRERTFIPNADKVYPKKKYLQGKEVGEETKDEAYKRSINETLTKLFHLGAAYLPEEELKAKVTATNWKDIIDKFNKALTLSGKLDTKLNFLTVWKNNDNKKTSNLVIPDRTKWVEAAVEGQAPTIKLNKWQIDNQLTEKYPYGSQDQSNGEVITGEGAPANTGDLPF